MKSGTLLTFFFDIRMEIGCYQSEFTHIKGVEEGWARWLETGVEVKDGKKKVPQNSRRNSRFTVRSTLLAQLPAGS
jgi:hypothetical protein